jgi:hypothetical protein
MYVKFWIISFIYRNPSLQYLRHTYMLIKGEKIPSLQTSIGYDTVYAIKLWETMGFTAQLQQMWSESTIILSRTDKSFFF